eukprot:76983-Amorphochlora_amoeboformis.AAC.1
MAATADIGVTGRVSNMDYRVSGSDNEYRISTIKMSHNTLSREKLRGKRFCKEKIPIGRNCDD